MPEVLIASDADWVIDDVKAALTDPDTTVREVRAGILVRHAVEEKTPDLVVLDLQIGNMGGMAVSLDLRLESDAGRLPQVPVLMLLDRRPDVFLAKRARADGWVVKPLDPIRLRKAARTLLAGGRFEDDAYRPVQVPATPPSPASAEPASA